MKSLHLPVLLAALALAATASAKVTEKISHTYPFDANGVISVANVNGSVEIVAWDKNEISLEAEKSARNEEFLQRLQIVIEHSPSKLVVKTHVEKMWKFWDNAQASVRYKLKVPAGVSLEKIDVVNAAIVVRGVQGFVNLDTVNGSIDAEGLASGGTFDTVNGSIRASFSRVRPEDMIDLDTVNGSCAVTLPKDSAFSLKAGSVNGGISCDFPVTIAKKGRNTLTGTVNGGGASVVLDSVNGGLSVKSAP